VLSRRIAQTSALYYNRSPTARLYKYNGYGRNKPGGDLCQNSITEIGESPPQEADSKAGWRCLSSLCPQHQGGRTLIPLTPTEERPERCDRIVGFSRNPPWISTDQRENIAIVVQCPSCMSIYWWHTTSELAEFYSKHCPDWPK